MDSTNEDDDFSDDYEYIDEDDDNSPDSNDFIDEDDEYADNFIKNLFFIRENEDHADKYIYVDAEDENSDNLQSLGDNLITSENIEDLMGDINCPYIDDLMNDLNNKYDNDIMDELNSKYTDDLINELDAHYFENLMSGINFDYINDSMPEKRFKFSEYSKYQKPSKKSKKPMFDKTNANNENPSANVDNSKITHRSTGTNSLDYDFSDLNANIYDSYSSECMDLSQSSPVTNCHDESKNTRSKQTKNLKNNKNKANKIAKKNKNNVYKNIDRYCSIKNNSNVKVSKNENFEKKNKRNGHDFSSRDKEINRVNFRNSDMQDYPSNDSWFNDDDYEQSGHLYNFFDKHIYNGKPCYLDAFSDEHGNVNYLDDFNDEDENFENETDEEKSNDQDQNTNSHQQDKEENSDQQDKEENPDGQDQDNDSNNGGDKDNHDSGSDKDSHDDSNNESDSDNDDNNNQEYPSVLREYSYFCYKCNIEFSSEGTVNYCIYCNDGFITQITDSNMASDEEYEYGTAMDDVLLDHPQLEEALHSTNTSNIDSAIRMYDNQLRSRRRGNNRDRRNITVSYVGDGASNRPNNNPNQDFGALFSNIIQSIQAPTRRNRSNFSATDDTFNQPDQFGFGHFFAGNTFNIDSIMHRIVESYGSVFNGGTANGTESDVIQSIQREKIDSESEYLGAKCSICLDAYSKGDNIKILECKHTFHSDCIIPWLNMHDSCPVCRSKIKKRSDHQPQ